MYRDTRSVTNGLAGVVAKSYHTNAAYDVDPSVGSTETYGFDEYAAIYSYYRVIGYSYEVTVINPMDYPLMAYILNTNIDASGVGTNYGLYSTNPHCKSKLISTIGTCNRQTFKGSHNISEICGTPAIETADSFRSVTSGVPSDLTWITVAGTTLGGADITFQYDLKLIMHVRFYGREVDLTLAGFAARVNAHLLARQQLTEKKMRDRELEDMKKKISSVKAQYTKC